MLSLLASTFTGSLLQASEHTFEEKEQSANIEGFVKILRVIKKATVPDAFMMESMIQSRIEQNLSQSMLQMQNEENALTLEEKLEKLTLQLSQVTEQLKLEKSQIGSSSKF
jgi:hypothetical protein